MKNGDASTAGICKALAAFRGPTAGIHTVVVAFVTAVGLSRVENWNASSGCGLNWQDWQVLFKHSIREASAVGRKKKHLVVLLLAMVGRKRIERRK